MEFIIEKQEEGYVVKEAGRTVFLCDHAYDEKLLSLYLRNIYGDEAISIYQIKKWYNPLNPKLALDFTIYEGEVKMGELHSVKGGFEFAFQGVLYRFYAGVRNGKRMVICFDREDVCAQMFVGDVSSVHFENSTLGAIMSILCILLKEFIPMERFSQTSFENKAVNANLQTI